MIVLPDEIKNKPMVEIYFISGGRKTLQEFNKQKLKNKLLVTILDGNGVPLQKYYPTTSYLSSGNLDPRSTILNLKREEYFLADYSLNLMETVMPWQFVVSGWGEACFYALAKRDFDVALQIEPSTLKEAKKILVELVR